MSSSYTAESVHRLLRHLVAPGFIDRSRADKLLFSMLAASGDRENPRLAALFDEATELFGDELPTFLEALLVFWMNAGAAAHQAGMKRFGVVADWQPLAGPAGFPLEERPRFGSASLFGMGIGEYLESQAERLRFLLPSIERGLRNPAPLVADQCWNMLAANAAEAASALPAMCALAFQRGPNFAPGRPMRGIAAIIDANPAQLAVLVNALAEDEADERAAVIAEIAVQLRTAPAALADAMLAAFQRSGASERRYLLFRGLAQMARRGAPLLCDRLLALAVDMTSSDDVELRAAAPWGLALLGDLARHEPALSALLADAEPLVRLDACVALSRCSEPTPAIVRAVAARLGDYGAFDDEPHAQARAALVAWGWRAEAAIDAVGDWLQRMDPAADEVRVESVVELLSALGPAARRLWPQVERYLAAVRGDAAESMAEAAHATDAASPVEQRQSTPSALDRFALSLGFDIHEDIPGTPSWNELATEPDGEARLRSWLCEARAN